MRKNKEPLFVYVTSKEKELIWFICRELHMTLSAFIRSTILRKAKEEYQLLKLTKEVDVEND